jgi:hypothetical protein
LAQGSKWAAFLRCCARVHGGDGAAGCRGEALEIL